VRNRLQYQRLYDEKGKFRSEVGTRAVSTQPTPGATPAVESNPNVRKRRVSGGGSEE
jgi:hypothetical protein